MVITKATKKAAAKARKATVKKSTRKKPSKKKPVKKTIKKKSVKKTAQKKPSWAAAKRKAAPKKTPSKKPLQVMPGPPAGSVPPVEEPSSHEEAIGVITHYYSHLGVAVVQLNKGSLTTGDVIHVKGHSTDFSQTVTSMEYEHQNIDKAGAGQNVGLKVIDQAREHDIVYRVK